MKKVASFPTILALTLTLSLTAQDAEARPPEPPAGEIACNRDGAILLVDVATAEETVLVEDNTYDRPLFWLPKGDRLVYWNHDGGAWDLWTVDPKTKKKQNLTESANDSRSISANLDGSKLAFMRGGQGVWVMDPNGSNQVQVSELGHRDVAPVWSPFSMQLAFNSLESLEGNRVAIKLHVVRFEDAKAGKVTEVLDFDGGDVAFFLNERQLVVSDVFRDRHDLVIVDMRTGARRALTKTDARDTHAVLSPGRRRIAWVEHYEEAGEEGEEPKKGKRLMHMWVNGELRRELAELDHFFAPPSWSPDNRHVVFENGKERGKYEVHYVSIEGGPVHTLCEGSFPVWRPMPKPPGAPK